jgi:hypothetical protein
MADEAAYLVDLLLPQSAYRQWCLTFPWPIRYLMAKDYKLITAILTLVLRCLFAWQRKMAKRAGHPRAKVAAVTFIQRWGRVVNSHVHFHSLLPDGVFVLDRSGAALRVVPLPPPTDEDIAALALKVARRVTAFCQKRFATVDDGQGHLLDAAILEAMRKIPRAPLSDEPDPDDAPEMKHLTYITETKVVEKFCSTSTSLRPHYL